MSLPASIFSYIYTASYSSISRSKVSTSSFMRPDSMRVKSKSSSTMRVRRRLSLWMISSPCMTSSGSVPPPASSVSLQPSMAVSGVRSSCETEEMKSFFMRSVRDISSDI